VESKGIAQPPITHSVMTDFSPDILPDEQAVPLSAVPTQYGTQGNGRQDGTPGVFVPAPAEQFIAAIGKNGCTRIRGFLPTGHPRKGSDRGRKGDLFLPDGTINAALIQQWQDEGRGVYFVVNNGGDTKAEITEIIAYFAEFDEGTKEEQLRRLNRSPLLTPSFVIDNGGKSIHLFWVLDEPIICRAVASCPNKAQWTAEQERIIAALGSDPSIKDPSRVLRMPAAWYAKADGSWGGQARVISGTRQRVSRQEFLDCLPELPKTTTPPSLHIQALPAQPAAQTSQGDAERTRRRMLDQLQRVPPRTPGTNTRNTYTKLLWALLAEFGEAEAVQLMSSHSPAWAAAEDLHVKCRDADGSVNAASFFHTVKEHWGITDPPRVAAPGLFPLDDPLGPQPVANGSTPPLAIDAAAIRQHLEDERRDSTHPYVTAATLLPAALAAPLHLRASRRDVPDIVLMAPLLATFASVLHRGIDVMLNEGTNYRQRPIIRAAGVARTGSGKSSSTEIGANILSRLQAEALAQHEQEEDEDAPPPRTYVINNFSIQGLMHAAQESKNYNCLIYVDELAALFKGLDQYAKNGKGNEGPLFLSLYDGVGFTGKYADKSRRYSVESTGYSVTGTIQHEVLADCIDNLNDTSGEWARWNFFPGPSRALKAHRGDNTPDGLESFVEETIDNLSRLGPFRYRLSKNAQMVFDDFYDRQGELAADPTIPPAVQAKHAKAMGSAGRFALLLHLVYAVWTDDPLRTPPDEISMATMDRAILLTEYFTAQHRSLYRRLLGEGAEGVDAQAIYVFNLCKRLHQQHKPITPQNIRAAWTRKTKPKMAGCSAFIDALVAAGFLHLASGGGLAPVDF
jgi:hypothetical protein